MCAESWIEAPQINDCAHVRNHGSRIPVSMIPHNPFCAETLTSQYACLIHNRSMKYPAESTLDILSF